MSIVSVLSSLSDNSYLLYLLPNITLFNRAHSLMDEFLKLAYDQAICSRKQGGIPIGSVLVKGGEVIGRGHNQRVQKKDGGLIIFNVDSVAEFRTMCGNKNSNILEEMKEITPENKRIEFHCRKVGAKVIRLNLSSTARSESKKLENNKM